jgi:hypothetical protein
MALTKSTAVDKIEIVGDYDIVQVREVTNIIEDGEIISQKFNRYSINPGESTSDKPAKVQAVVSAVHTQSVIDSYTAHVTKTGPSDE